MTDLKEENPKGKKRVAKKRDEISELKESVKGSKLRDKVMKKIVEKLEEEDKKQS
jgi:hypothetical protein